MIRDDDYIFDKNGNFTGKVIPRKAPHRLVMPDKQGVKRYYKFADQKNDPINVTEKDALGNHVAKAIPIKRREILKAMEESNAFDENSRTPLVFTLRSVRQQPYDYALGYLKKNYPIPEYIDNKDTMFFLPEEDGYAYNTFNFGNFLWGATGKNLGYSPTMLKLGAHANNMFSGRDYGSNYQILDSPDDQFSIQRGARFVDRNQDLFRGKTRTMNFNYIIP